MDEYGIEPYEVYLLGGWFFIILACLCSVLYDALKCSEEMKRWEEMRRW